MTRHRLPSPVRRALAAARPDAGEDADLLDALGEVRLFDPAWYLARNPDVAAAGMDPRLHYLRHGAPEGRWPGPAFDPAAWVADHPEAAAHPGGPLFHHLAVAGEAGTQSSLRPVAPGRTGPPVHLGRPTAVWEGDRLSIACALGERTTLRAIISGPRATLERVEPRVEPFLFPALMAAAASGRDLSVAQPVDRDLLVSLRLRLLPLVSQLYGLPPIAVRAVGAPWTSPTPTRSRRLRRGHTDTRPPDPAGLAFSAGVDSLYSLIRLREAGHPLTVLININAGAHGPDRTLMGIRFARTQAMAARMGLDALLVDTNLHEVVRAAHEMVWPFRNLPAAYVLHGAMQGIVSSSSQAWRDLSFERTTDYVGYAGPGVTSVLAWSRMPIMDVGHELRRYEKLRLLSDHPLTHDTLDVCTNGQYQADPSSSPINCGRCVKCVLNVQMLEHMGRLDRYASVFDVEAYRRERDLRQRVLQDALVGRSHHSPVSASDPPVPIASIGTPAAL